MNITKTLEQYTAQNSGFETSRHYVSLSNAASEPQQLIYDYFHGFTDGHLIRLRCYKGYQMERDLLQRMFQCLPVALHPEITAHNDMVKGHPDYLYDKQYPGECKSVPLDAHLPEKLLPRKVYWQLQAYALYSNAPRAVAIYESRETGIIRDYWVDANPRIQTEIKTKYQFVVNEINLLSVPVFINKP